MVSIPRASGVYQIRCLVNGRLYVGSSNNLHKRWLYHKRDLRVGCHKVGKLQDDYNRYGLDAFVFEVIELVLEPFIRDREQYWIDCLKPHRTGYNTGRDAHNAFRGLHHTPRSRQRLSDASKANARPITPEQRAKMVQGLQTPEARERCRQARLGRQRPEHERQHYILTDSNGHEHYVTNIAVFAKEHGLSHGNLVEVARGRRQQHKGWICRYVIRKAA